MNRYKSDPVGFTKNLVKGRIAETIFAQMLRETKKFTVLEFGYEKIVPELLQSDMIANDTLEIIRRAPDFAVINKETKEVKLIEVKYQSVYNKNYTLRNAARMVTAWNPSYIFLVTNDGFYFDNIKDIIVQEGDISPLKHAFLPKEIQNKYLELLREIRCV